MLVWSCVGLPSPSKQHIPLNRVFVNSPYVESIKNLKNEKVPKNENVQKNEKVQIKGKIQKFKTKTKIVQKYVQKVEKIPKKVKK